MSEHDDEEMSQGRSAPPDPAELALARAVRRLPQSIEPSRDLWPQIAARLEDPASPAPAPRWRAVAMAAGLMAFSSITTLWWTERDAVPPLLALQGAHYDMAGTAYLQARANLAIDAEARLARLPAETRSKIRQNLAVIRSALDEISLALARDPDNMLLQQLLLATYQQELGVLSDLTQVIEAASATRIET